MIIRELTMMDEEKYKNYMSTWQEEQLVVPYSTNRENFSSYNEMLDQYAMYLKNPPDQHVPSITHYLFVEDQIAGAVNIRLGLTDFLLNKGGHIGYGVSPNFRGYHYSRDLLEHGIKILLSMNINDILVTCDHDNTASKNTIINSGGIEDIPFIDGEEKTLRFWIKR